MTRLVICFIGVTLASGAFITAWAGGDSPGTGGRILWINAGEGQTDSTWSAAEGTGSIFNEGKGGFSHWAGFLEELGFENAEMIESEIVLSWEILADHDIVVFSFTNRDYDAGETEALAEWVSAGGKVLVIGSFALGHSDNPHNSTVLAPFGIAFGDREQTRLLELTDFSAHPITKDVELVQSDVADYLDVEEGVEVLATYKGRPALAVARYGEGEVVAFWDCNGFFNGVYAAWDLPCIHDADNKTFATNLFRYLVGESEVEPPPSDPSDEAAPATPTEIPAEPTLTPTPTSTPTPGLLALGPR